MRAATPIPAARYSAALEGSLFVLAALRVRGARRRTRRCTRGGAPAVRRDLEALEAWRRRYESRAGDVHEKVNDAYLRAQGRKA